MKNQTNPFGFTLLEMLTAIAIIAVMIGLLIPAVGKIQDTARTVKQKAQFGAIEIALEAFNTDTWDYPPSSYTSTGAANTGYTGAQKLAEAIIGQDGFGFHPQSQWRSDGMMDTDNNGTGDVPLYMNAVNYDTYYPNQSDKNANIKVRKGPYLELEKANAVKIDSIYNSISNIASNTHIIADMFGNIKNRATGKKTGVPILYFKADSSKYLHYPTAYANPNDSIYNIQDNAPFIDADMPRDSIEHPLKSSLNIFYDRIVNPNFTSPQRPYRASSFILLSAGPDGLYGTPDDVYNIDENEK